jgi:alanine dehydrogenase
MHKTIAVPKEIKKDEGRISLTPKSVKNLSGIANVLIEEDAGLIAGYSNSDYTDVGGSVIQSKEELFDRSDVICKVKEPLEGDIKYLNKDHLIFGYLHLSSSYELTKKLMDIGLTGIAMELIWDEGHYPLLTPMSEIAGELAFSKGLEFLDKESLTDTKVLIIGCGVVGEASIRGAVEKRCRVTAVDLNEKKLDSLREKYKEYESTLSFINTQDINLDELIEDADMVIGAVLVPGGKPPTVVSNSNIKSMKPGSVIVDVAIDQGGCVEDISATTHSQPFMDRDGVKVLAIANLPGSLPDRASVAISNQIEKYLPFYLNNNWIDSIHPNETYEDSLQVHNGMLLSKPVSDSLGIALSTLI